MKRRLSIAAAVIFIAGSAVHPFGRVDVQDRGTLFRGGQVDSSTLALLSRACRNCHSHETEMPWYGHVAPMSWMIERDVQTARSKINFSRWQSYSIENRITILSAMGAAARSRVMPPQRYVALHPEADLTDAERRQIYEWTRAERKRLSSARAAGGT